jgi:hypothetical protein
MRGRGREQAKDNQQRLSNHAHAQSFFPAQITRPMIFTSSVGRS